MDSRKGTEGSYPELFPKDYPERLERLIELLELTWEEFAERLGVGIDRVTAWREGTIPTGGEVWHIMRLAFSVPGGMEVMLPEAAEGAE
jgi:transcriptional regulator with XRE-family HTH domain